MQIPVIHGSKPMSTVQSWIELWSGPHPLWLNDRHLKTRCRIVMDDILGLLIGRDRPVVLDYGCGEALESHRIAAVAKRIYLYDAPLEIRNRVKQLVSTIPNAQVVDDEGQALPPATLDVVVMSSVIQYVPQAKLESLLAQFHKQLKPGGEIMIGDVIPPKGDHINYVRTLLGDGLRHGYFWAAVRGMIIMRFSRYWDMKQTLKYSYYSDSDITGLLRRYGFEPERLPANIGGNRGRMSFRARKLG